MNVKEIVENYLKREGFGGLVCQEIPCECLVGDLGECADVPFDCEPGHKHNVDPAENDGAEWLMFPGKCGPDCPGNPSLPGDVFMRVGPYSAPEWIEKWIGGAKEERTET